MTFEEALPVLNEMLILYRSRWTFVHRKWEDVAQDIRIRAFDKFDLYDQAKPLKPWCARLIQNAMSNALRDAYYRFKPPCNKCPMELGDGHCKMYVDMAKCTLYKRYIEHRRKLEAMKFPTSLEAVSYDVSYEFSADAQPIVNAIYAGLSGMDRDIFHLYHASGLSTTQIAKTLEASGMAQSKKMAYIKCSITATKDLAKEIIAERKVVMGFA